MNVEIWMDVVCPWCYIGRRRFEKALGEFPGRDGVEVTFRSYELDPHAPYEPTGNVVQMLSEKYGMSPAEATLANERVARIAAEEGLEFHLERARPTNTLDAHRLLQLAGIRHVRPVVEERFQRAYFAEGAVLADPATLLLLATEAGLAEGDVRRVLAGQAFTLQVRSDERAAAALGAHGVPFFVIGGTDPVSGAPPADVFRRSLELAAGSDGDHR